MSSPVTLIIAGTESKISTEDLTIERIIAEAHSVGYKKFSVFCNDQEIDRPDTFKAIPNSTYIIAAPEHAINPNDIAYAGHES